MKSLSICIACISVTLFTSTASAATASATWLGPMGLGGNGNWTDFLLWSGAIVPNNGVDTFDVFIDGGKGASSNVTLNTNATIDSLTVDFGDQLTVISGRILTLATGSLANDGVIQINGGNISGVTFQNSGNMSGNGTVMMSDNGNNRILTDGSTLTQGSMHTIQGAGQLLADTGDMINNGTIRQIGSNKLIIDTQSTFTNNGTLEAAGGGGIDLVAGIYEFGSTSLTVMTGSKVDLGQNVVIRNATLVTSGSGVVNVNSTEDGAMAISAVQFENLINNASVVQNSGEDSHILGTFMNNGTWSLNGGNTTDMTFAGGISIAGSGAVMMSDNANNRILTDGSTLTQGSTHTIQGAGQLLANTGDMINNGTIRQIGSNKLVIDTLSTFTNNGVLEATGGGGIDLVAGIYEFGTTMLTITNGSKVDLGQNVVIRNATLVTSGSGVVNVNSTEDGAMAISAVQFENLINNASVVQNSGEDSHILGTFTNNNTWSLNGGNTTDIMFDGAVTIAGDGEIVMSDNANNRILTNGSTLVHGVDHKIEGAGQLLANTGDMINNGIIRQIGSNKLVINTLDTFTNNGTLEATGGGGIDLMAGIYEFGTTMLTVMNGSKVDLGNNVVIRNATLATSGSGVVNVNSTEDGAVAISAVQFENVVSEASVVQNSGEDSHILGTFTNNDTWSLNGGNLTDMMFDGAITIAGNGEIVMSNNPNNRILTNGSTLVHGIGHKIEGAGQLLANTGDMINNGTIRQIGSNKLVIDTLGTFTNKGTLEATGGGGIELVAGIYELGTSTLTVKMGSKLDLGDNVVVRNTRLVTEDNGVVNVNSVENGSGNAVQFENLISDASVVQNSGEDSHIFGTFTNNGTWSLNGGNPTDMTFDGGVTIAGNGEIAMSNNGNNRLIGSGGEIVNSANHTIRGAGQLLGTDFRNQGELLVNGSNGLVVSSTAFVNEGTVNITNKLTRAGEYVQSAGLTTVNGELEANLVTMSGGTLMGDGLVDADLVNTGGLINVGNSAGELDVDGTFAQSAGTFLVEIEGSGAGMFDVLDITGDAMLGGLIDVSLLGYTPTIGETFDVLFAANIFGNFANASAFNAGGFTWMAVVIENLGGDDLVRLSAVAPVPLPAAFWMLLSAFGVLGTIRRRAV